MKKRGSYVNKGNKLIEQGNTPAAMQIVLEGLNYYQKKVIKSLNPYPTSDAALLVIALKNFAEAVAKENPECQLLVDELETILKVPQFLMTEKVQKVK